MADFIQTAVSKSATRELRYPHATYAGYETIVNNAVANAGVNWGCVPYTSPSQGPRPAAEITAQYYAGRVSYQNTMGRVIATITIRAPNKAAFDTARTEIYGNTAIETAIGGTAIYDQMTDTFSTTVRCNSASGDIFNVAFTRKSVRVTSYNDDAVLAALETWADGISALD